MDDFEDAHECDGAARPGELALVFIIVEEAEDSKSESLQDSEQ